MSMYRKIRPDDQCLASQGLLSDDIGWLFLSHPHHSCSGQEIRKIYNLITLSYFKTLIFGDSKVWCFLYLELLADLYFGGF